MIKITLRGLIGVEVTAESVLSEIKLAAGQDIELRLESPGGSVMEGLPIFNALKAHDGKVTAVLDGRVASIATYIACACSEVQATANAMFMVHGPAVGAQGNEGDMQAAIAQLRIATDTIVKAYAEKTGKPADDIQAKLQSDWWMSAQEAKEYGFIDAIIEPHTLTNSQQSYVVAQSVSSQVIPATVPAQSTTPINNTDLLQARQTEFKRGSDIRALFKDHDGDNLDTLMNSCLDDINCTPDIAATKLLAQLGNVSASARAPSNRVSNGNHVMECLSNTLEARCNVAQLQSDNGLSTYTLMDMARELAGSGGGSHYELIARAFNSGDLHKIIGSTIDKVVRDQVKVEKPVWRQFCSTDNLSNFNPKEIITINDFPGLMPVSEEGEYKQAKLTGSKELIRAGTYGRQISITRQTITNDDMSLINKVPRSMVSAGYRLVSNMVFKLLLSDHKLSDNKNVFIADKNLFTGTADKLDELVLKLAKAIAKAKTNDGEPMDLKGAILLAGHDLGPHLNPIIKTPGNAEKYNPCFGKFKSVIETGYLDDFSGFFGLTSKDFESIVLGFVNGQQDPWFEQLTGGFESDGLKYRVTYDVGAKIADRRGMTKAKIGNA